MKTLLIALAVAFSSSSTLLADDVVVAGRIAGFAKETGTLTLLPENRATTPMTFVNMDRAVVLLPTGERGSPADLQPGRGATIHHVVSGNRLIVSKVVLSAPPIAVVPVVPVLPGAGLTAAEKRALETPAANDGDRTTNPGVKARIDNDITTKPGKKDALERDITKKPADSANTDGDRTTRK